MPLPFVIKYNHDIVRTIRLAIGQPPPAPRPAPFTPLHPPRLPIMYPLLSLSCDHFPDWLVWHGQPQVGFFALHLFLFLGATSARLVGVCLAAADGTARWAGTVPVCAGCNGGG